MRLSLSVLCAVAIPVGCFAATAQPSMPPPSLKVGVQHVDKNVLDARNKDMSSIKYGIEGGEVIRDAGGTYHLFTSEQNTDPFWLLNRLGHWTSADGLDWHRDNRWAMKSTGDQTGARDKGNIWDPTMAYDDTTAYWYMFYVGYRYSPAKGFFDAKIYRTKSTRRGRDGLSGPYHYNDADDVVAIGPIAKPGPYEAKWVGDLSGGAGATSVTVYPTANRWTMLWAMNMLATASSPASQFHRLPESNINPVSYGRAPMDWAPDYLHTTIQQHFYHENPIVIQIAPGRVGAGTFLMVTGNFVDYTAGVTHSVCGYATSPDGLRWSELRPLDAGLNDCMTVISLLPESGNRYTMFVTAHDQLGKPGPSSGQIMPPTVERMSRVMLTVADAKIVRQAIPQ